MSILDQPKITPAIGRSVRLLDAPKIKKPKPTPTERAAMQAHYRGSLRARNPERIRLQNLRYALRKRIKAAQETVERAKEKVEALKRELAEVDEKL